MIQIDDKTPWREFLREETEKVASLLDDLQRIAAGTYPTHGELSVAPLIVNPRPTIGPEMCLAGLAVGHPILGNKPVSTSACVVYAPALGWARTWSRLYRVEWHG